MKLSYAITVCNESKELYSLISFLKTVKDLDDEINVLVDSKHVSSQVLKVIEFFKSDIVINERDFCGSFSDHRNYQISKCNGDYIFIIDADEMPQESLIKNIKQAIIDIDDVEIIHVPRINICPGYTQEWIQKCNFTVNEVGWINWPDYSVRVFKNIPSIRYNNNLHEKISSSGKSAAIPANPLLALWHIKSVEKQDNRWDPDTKEYVSPGKENLYDSLM